MINCFLPAAKLCECFHVCTVTRHSMVNDALSAIVPIVAANQSPINIVVVGRGGSVRLFASPARNSQSATVRVLLLALYCIESMFTLK